MNRQLIRKRIGVNEQLVCLGWFRLCRNQGLRQEAGADHQGRVEGRVRVVIIEPGIAAAGHRRHDLVAQILPVGVESVAHDALNSVLPDGKDVVAGAQGQGRGQRVINPTVKAGADRDWL